VAAVGDQVVPADQRRRIAGSQADRMRLDLHPGVDRGERGAGAVDLEGADSVGSMHDLPLQIGEIDPVGIGDADRPNTGGGEVEEHRRAEAAGADDEDARGEELRLPLLADLVEDQVAGVALKLLLAELHDASQIPSKSTVDK